MSNARHLVFITVIISLFRNGCNCLTNELRVVGGNSAVINKAPFIVSFQQNGVHYCAGSILTKNWIVTAAHCLSYNALVLSTLLIAGSIYVNGTASTTQKRSINKYIVNDLYLGDTSPYDIGMVYTSNPFKFLNAVAPITLPVSGYTATGYALLYGWGSISATNTESYPSTLQVARVPIIPQSACERALVSQGANIHTTNICTGPLTGGIGICTSDSGGPLVQTVKEKNILIGIVSWGQLPCGQKNSPSVYVEVAALLKWIAKQIA